MRLPLAFCLIACAASAQPNNGVQTARLEGQVLNDRTDQPLRRAHVTLRPVEAGLTSIGVEAADDGTFLLHDVTPGRYTLLAERDGYLSNSICLHGALRMPPVIAIASNQHLTGITFRLRPWATLAGQISFEDADPGVNVRVIAYREYHRRGRHGYEAASSTLTDDRGEYRMYGLQPGVYFIAATSEKSAPERGYHEQAPVDSKGHELPVTGYTTTFYPNTVTLSEAVPVRLDYGQEVRGIGIVMHPVRKVNLRGRITSGVTGEIVTGASIALQRTDSHNNGSLPAPAMVNFDRNGNFLIRSVTPGPYLVTAEGSAAGTRLTGRAMLTVTGQDIENLDLIVSPELAWRGTVRIEGGGDLKLTSSLVAALEPRTERTPAVNTPADLNGFPCKVTADETYDVYVRNLPDDFYLSSVRVNGSDAMETGLEGKAASPDKPFELVFDSRGGRVGGVVAGPDDNAWSGASMALIPDPPKGRLQAYQESAADEYGRFLFRGVAPGKYILIAWLDDPPCDYYDAQSLDSCRAQGMPVTVSQAGQESLLLTMKPKQ